MSTAHPVALVTGASRRIGAAICRMLHDNGYNIVIHFHRSRAAAEALAAEFNARRDNSAKTMQADLNDLTQILALASYGDRAWGGVDALINNASSFYATPLASATEQDWDNLINSNLKAPFFLSAALKQSLAERQGAIVNIADIFAERPMPNHSIYSIAKAGNSMLTKALALELAPDVRVNGIAPGAILWPEDQQGQEKVDKTKLQSIPMQRLGGAHSIAEAVLFLLKRADYITGQILRVDGGRSLKQ